MAKRPCSSAAAPNPAGGSAPGFFLFKAAPDTDMKSARRESVQRSVWAGGWIGLWLLAGAAGSLAADPGRVAAQAPSARASAAAAKAAAAKPAQLIDINSASRAQLKTLPGIGDAEADKIIAKRPYLSKTHLVDEAGIPAGVYLTIRHRIVAVQNKAARAKLQAMASARAKSQASAPQTR
jgi:hypothetical protein